MTDLLQIALQWLGTRGLLGLFLDASTMVLRALLGFDETRRQQALLFAAAFVVTGFVAPGIAELLAFGPQGSSICRAILGIVGRPLIEAPMPPARTLREDVRLAVRLDQPALGLSVGRGYRRALARGMQPRQCPTEEKIKDRVGMRALIQRTSGASVEVEGEVIGEISAGLVIFVCAMRGDGEAESEWLARKCVALRIFRDDEGRMNRSVLDVGGSALVISQFTLAAETKGNRPGFSTAAAPEDGRRLYEHFAAQIGGHGVSVATGTFGADMKVALVNDGPVTIWLDTASR